ncbi:MAG: class I SAM-dependent methyltransferase, partial [Phycisphaeraceae bacterium]|nr:class I SAM-dependent methyltransferase [Phycisphaeraceae bacterium]
IVMFRNSQGRDGRGTLLHITRVNVVFEVYNPYSIVQTSEVMQTVKIIRGQRRIYQGRAMVNNIVTTGLMTIVSASLIDAWSDLEGLVPGKGLQMETERFVHDWRASYQLRPDYQLIVSTIRGFLGELSRWLEEAEAGILEPNIQDQEAVSMAEAFYRDIQSPVAPEVEVLFVRFEEEASSVPEDQVMAHKAFARRELHPLTLCSPFVHRSFTKPLGYAGDYEMVNMMLGESTSRAPSTYARIVDAFHIQTAAPEAHRNRIDMLQQRLDAEAERVHQLERPFVALNVGCGPAVEVQRFVRNNPLAAFADFTLMDFNGQTLEHAETKVREAMQASGHDPMLRIEHKSIDDLLKEAHRQAPESAPRHDMIYCAGLFDYFSDRVCRQLLKLFYGRVRPGGLVVATNVHRCNPNRHLMEHILEWHLVYRDEQGFARLAPDGPEPEVVTDSTGVNVFMDLRRPEGA